MYMVSLKQAAGIAREEMTSLDAITAELLNFIQLKSQRLYMHSLQVANYSVSVAAKLTLPKSEIEQVKYAALLHDVGLLFVSNTLLAKMPYLNRSEKAQYKRHAAGGGNMLENIPCCQDIVPYIRYHHEHWDGSGFPKHLRIPKTMVLFCCFKETLNCLFSLAVPQLLYSLYPPLFVVR